MAFRPKKVNYVDDETVIYAENMNDIQDAIIDSEDDIIRYTSYVVCQTAANTTAKTAALSGFTLEVGATIRVKFANTNTAANPTLNVNSTGAKPIYTNTGSPVGTTPDTAWAAGEIVELVYDGTNWVRPAGAMGSVGSLADLETTNKSTIVAAINEVNGIATDNEDNIGDLSDLDTTAQSDIVSAINEVNGIATDNESNIGDLSDLDTTAKSDVVSAINEVNGIATNNETNIGDLSDLDTTTQSDIVSAVNEVLGNQGYLSNLETTAKSNLVAAINEVNAETDVIDKLNAVIVVTPTFSSLPQTFTDAQLTFENGNHITPDLVCGIYDFRLSNWSAMLPPWTINTDVEGQITITGGISGSTNMKLYLYHTDAVPPIFGVDADYIGAHNIIKVELNNITSLPVTFTGMTGVTPQHEALVAGYGSVTPKSSLGGDWTVTCGDETVTISGTFVGSTATTVKLTLCIPNNKITKSAS